MKKGRITGEIALPEAIIQHIQSFMNGKEAARTTLLSKSWYHAWLSRPSLDFDSRNFQWNKFQEFTTKTIQRYEDLSLKIDSFSLRTASADNGFVHKLTVKALKMGATHVQLEFPYLLHLMTLPQEVLGFKTLVRLSIFGGKFRGNCVIRCSNLKSLTLNDVKFRSADMLKDIILCCISSIEELSLSYCDSSYSPYMRWMSSYQFLKLRLLFLAEVYVDDMFFTEFAARFPSLKDLSILLCRGYTSIQMAITSLETINFKPFKGSWKAKFVVPNIRKFTYACSGLPSQLSIEGASRAWEFDISITCNQFHRSSWFQNLKMYLSRFRLSRITLSMRLRCQLPDERHPHRVYSEVDGEPLALENLMIDAPTSFCSALLIRLFEVFHPNFITHYWLTVKCNDWFCKNEALDILCMRLMQKPITPNCGVPNQNMFGRFHLKKVNVEVYQMFGAEWRPRVLKKPLDVSKAPVSKRKIRFELIWGD